MAGKAMEYEGAAEDAAEVVAPVQLPYDMPPPQWVEGTVVPQDTPPEDMTDEEYVQWCIENRMPMWAVRKEIYLRVPPVLSGLEPSTAEIGAPSFDIKVSGTGFIPDSVIVFAGHDEPTQLNEDGTVSTGVNMSVWHGADVLPVSVRNGSQVSEPLDFTFTAAPEGARTAEKPAAAGPKKPTRAQLNEMTKDELVAYADDHDVDVVQSWPKADIVDAIARHKV